MKAEKLAAIVAASAACCATHAFQSHVHRRITPPVSMPASPLFANKKAKGGGGGKGFGAPRATSSEEASARATDNAPLVATAPDTAVVPSSPSEPATNEERGDGGAAARKGKGDAVRGATGIRPSLHPTAVNCVAEALRLRCRGLLGRCRDA
jgi:hypothetical protein